MEDEKMVVEASRGYRVLGNVLEPSTIFLLIITSFLLKLIINYQDSNTSNVE